MWQVSPYNHTRVEGLGHFLLYSPVSIVILIANQSLFSSSPQTYVAKPTSLTLSVHCVTLFQAFPTIQLVIAI